MNYIENNMTIKWLNDGKEYCCHIQRDDDCESPREWEHIATMACFHNRYNLGDKIETNDPDKFWRRLVHEYVSNEEIITAATNGVFDFLKVEECEQGEYSSFDENAYEISLLYKIGNKEPKWLVECRGIHQEDLADHILDCLLEFDDYAKFLEPYVEWLPLYLFDHSGLSMSTSSFGDPWDSGQVGWIYVSKDKMFKETHATEDDWRERAAEIMEDEVATYSRYLRGEVYGYILYVKEDGEWSAIESWWGFYGDTLNNGMVGDVGFGMAEAIEKGEAEFGEAKRVISRRWQF